MIFMTILTRVYKPIYNSGLYTYSLYIVISPQSTQQVTAVNQGQKSTQQSRGLFLGMLYFQTRPCTTSGLVLDTSHIGSVYFHCGFLVVGINHSYQRPNILAVFNIQLVIYIWINVGSYLVLFDIAKTSVRTNSP